MKKLLFSLIISGFSPNLWGVCFSGPARINIDGEEQIGTMTVTYVGAGSTGQSTLALSSPDSSFNLSFQSVYLDRPGDGRYEVVSNDLTIGHGFCFNDSAGHTYCHKKMLGDFEESVIVRPGDGMTRWGSYSTGGKYIFFHAELHHVGPICE